jgi:hypothetical protein
MSGINLGHHYLPTYQILMISDNVEFLPSIFMPCFGSHFENESYGKLKISYINVDNFYMDNDRDIQFNIVIGHY